MRDLGTRIIYYDVRRNANGFILGEMFNKYKLSES